MTSEEYDQLEQNVLKDGIRDPLCIWNDTIIDGHNRYEIAQKHNLRFETKEMDFQSERDAVIWVIDNQFGRRNISNYDRSKLALARKALTAQKAKKKLSTHTKQGYQKSEKAVNTAKELAKTAGVSHDTINKVENIESKAIEPVKQLAQSGDISINQAAQVVKMPIETQEKVLPYIKQGVKAEVALYHANKDEAEAKEKPLEVEILDVPKYVKEKAEQKAKEFDAKVDLGKRTYNRLSKIVESAIYYHPTEESMDGMYLLYNEFVPLDDQIKKIDEIIKKLQYTKTSLLIRKGMIK